MTVPPSEIQREREEEMYRRLKVLGDLVAKQPLWMNGPSESLTVRDVREILEGKR